MHSRIRTGKGNLVKEVDALDGLMGRVADAAGIQFRVLNASRGPAVHVSIFHILFSHTCTCSSTFDGLQGLPACIQFLRGPAVRVSIFLC